VPDVQVCDDYFTDAAAKVVCEALGFFEGRAYCCAAYGQGTNNITLDDVVCSGTESSLNECAYRTSGNNCDHSEDVGIACSYY